MPKKRGGESPAEPGGIAPAAFEALLSAARTVIAAERTGGDKASPFQVFEANVPEGHERREAALKEQDRRADVRSGAAERLDRTSVESRRALRSARLSDVAGVEGADACRARVGTKEVSAASSGGLGARGTVECPDPSDAGRPAVRAGGMLVSPGELQGAPAREEKLPAGRAADLSAPARGAPGADRPSAAAAVPLAGSGVTRPETPAHQVAQILGAGRVGEGDGGRAVASPPAAGVTRPTGAEQQTAGRGGMARQAGAGTPSRPGEGAEGGKPGAVARSPFDELVRSIRLRNGSRWSSATLHLEPPRLGRVRVEVKLVGKALNIDVLTETSAGRDAVARRAEELRAALEQQGVHVERFDVVAEAPEPGYYDPGFDDGSSASLNGDRQGREQADVSPPTETGGSADGTEASGNPDAVVDEAVVSETRLDIRV